MEIGFEFSLGRLNAHYEGAYDERAMRWRRIGAIEKTRNLRDLLGSRAEEISSVLEVGCGTGAVLHEVAKAIGKIHVGTDTADPMDHADPDAIKAGIDLRLQETENIDFRDNSFDLVYATHVLEHVADERAFLGEIGRVAAKYVYIEVPCELHLRSSARTLQKTLGMVGHINAYTPESFGLTLATSGLEILDLKVFDHLDELYAFESPPMKAFVRKTLRRTLLKASPQIASRVFTYHCGALCVPKRATVAKNQVV